MFLKYSLFPPAYLSEDFGYGQIACELAGQYLYSRQQVKQSKSIGENIYSPLSALHSWRAFATVFESKLGFSSLLPHPWDGETVPARSDLLYRWQKMAVLKLEDFQLEHINGYSLVNFSGR